MPSNLTGTCRFGQRCGEVKIKIGTNVQVPMAEQLRISQEQVRILEQKLNQKDVDHAKAVSAIRIEMQNLRKEAAANGSVQRTLTAEEHEECKKCVHALLAQAKIVLAMQQAEVRTTGQISERTKQKSVAIQSQALQFFCKSVQNMDVRKLAELTTAMGQLVQVIYTEREMLSFYEKLRLEMVVPHAPTSVQSSVSQTPPRRVEGTGNSNAEVVMSSNHMHATDEVNLKQTVETNYPSAGAGKERNTAASNDIGKQLAREDARDMLATMQRGNYFLKTSHSLGTKNVRFVCLANDLSCLYWRHVDGSGSPSRVDLTDFISFEITGRNFNSILMTLKEGNILKFKYVNGADAADSAQLAAFWCDALTKLRAWRLHQITLQASESIDKQNINIQHEKSSQLAIQKVPHGTPVRNSSELPSMHSMPSHQDTDVTEYLSWMEKQRIPATTHHSGVPQPLQPGAEIGSYVDTAVMHKNAQPAAVTPLKETMRMNRHATDLDDSL